MAYAVGIDLGTTNSVISVFRRGQAETLSIDGRRLLPSIVSFREEGTALIGQAAKARLIVEPESTISSSKRFMGDTGKTWKIGKRSLTPVNVASLILRRLAEGVSATLGEPVRDVVITVPAYFTEAEKEATKRAGLEAGLNVLRLIPEPTAAAISYGLDKGKNQTLLVYDLGGGTFDVSLLEVRGNQFSVKAVGGDSQLGGDDFDIKIMEWVCSQLPANLRPSPQRPGNREERIALQRLKEAAEKAKIELSEADRTQISIPDFLGHPLDIELDLAQYNALIRPLLERTIACMRSVLRDAGMTPEDITRVLLVGGSTKNRAVRELVAREIKEPYISERVDEVVSHGAAIVAADLFAPAENNVPIEVSDVTGHSLGVDMLDENHDLYFHKIIPRQSVFPCRCGYLGSTNHPMQDRVDFIVYRGEQSVPQANTRLGELSLPVGQPEPELVPIGVIFELDADGIIHFTAVDIPVSEATLPIIEHAMRHDGTLDVESVDALLKRRLLHSKTVRVQS